MIRKEKDDEGFEDVELDEDRGFESEEGGLELANIAMTREEVTEFLHRNDDDITVEESHRRHSVCVHRRAVEALFDTICGAQDSDDKGKAGQDVG